MSASCSSSSACIACESLVSTQSLSCISDQIKEKEEETSELSNQYSAADADYSQKKSNLKKLLNEAEKIAPKEEWHERLDQDDLPVDLEGVDEALDEAESKVNSITDNPHVMRQYEERKKEIAKLQDQLDEAGGEKDMKKKQLESKTAIDTHHTNQTLFDLYSSWLSSSFLAFSRVASMAAAVALAYILRTLFCIPSAF